jgi:hypothetical protein
MSTTILRRLTLYIVVLYGRCRLGKPRLFGGFLELNLLIPETSFVQIMILAHLLGRG